MIKKLIYVDQFEIKGDQTGEPVKEKGSRKGSIMEQAEIGESKKAWDEWAREGIKTWDNWKDGQKYVKRNL